MKNLRKITAIFLSAVFTVSLLAAGERRVFANLQTPVTDMIIEDLSLAGRTDYRINLSWAKPPKSTTPDTAAIDGTVDHDIQGYNIYYRNVTAGESYKSVPDGKAGAGDLAWGGTFTTFRPGSIYMFKVEPYHDHTYERMVNGALTQYKGTAPFDRNAGNTREALYLTDITVEATGIGNQITVTWDKPLFNGVDIFNGYKISYALGGTTIETIPDGTSTVVYRDNPELKTVSGRYSYTFEGINLTQGRVYALKVEPLYNNNLIRQTSDNTVVIGSASYRLSFTQREYRTNDLYIKPSLYVEAVDAENVRIYWDSFLQSTLSDYITSLKIEKSLSPLMTSPETVLTLLGRDTATSITSTYSQRPSVTTYYKMTVYYNETADGVTVQKSIESVVAEYNPATEQFTPTKPDILDVTNTNSVPVRLDVTWAAFTRPPYNDAERSLLAAGETEIIDKYVAYDIWVTDDLLNFSDPAFEAQKIVSGLKAADLREFLFKYTADNTQKTKQAYSYGVDHYAAWNGDSFEKRLITDNKIYYIRIVSRRTQGKEQVSEPAYYSYFVAPINDITTAPIMLSRPPLAVKVNSNGAEEITKDSITIEWENIWYEIYDDATNSWYSRIGIKSGALYFGGEIDDGTQTVIELRGSAFGADAASGVMAVKSRLKILGVADDDIDFFPVRQMDLRNAGYDISAATYDYVESAGGYDNYLASLPESGWVTISPAISATAGRLEYTVLAATVPSAAKLNPDTSYVIALRPFVSTENGKLTAYYPSYVVDMTLNERPPVDIIPTVPSLTPVSSTDQSVTVSFVYSEGLEYELYYSELLSKYPGGGTVVSSADIRLNGILTSSGSNSIMTYEIKGLFPETMYYVWIRARANNYTGAVYSEYSNPVNLTTKQITAPLAPVGLGLASMTHVDAYNKENSVSYLPIDVDYIIAEWFRDANDISSQATAGKGGVSGSAEILMSPSLLETYMVKFNALTGNKGYYFRVKTVLTVTKTGGGVQSYYQYIVQMSQYENFLDAVEITVPLTIGPTDPMYTKTKESEWSNTVRFVTSKYKGEYDGDKDPSMYPLPEQDYETIYDRYANRLTLRFRSNGVDAQGNRDNFVDQRFIASLIQSRTYEYNVNMAFYGGKALTNRVLELPYSIVRAFEERKIILSITTDSSIYKLQPGFFNTTQITGLKDLGANSYIRITLNNDTSGLPALDSNRQSYASPAQKMTITVVSPSGSVSLKYTKSNTSVALNLSSRYITLDKNVGSYTYNSDSGKWTRNSDSYDKANNELKFTTNLVSVYSAIADSVPLSLGQTPTEDLYDVATKLNFADMPHYDPGAAVPALYINKIMAAVARGATEVFVTSPLTDDEYNSLQKSGMLLTGGNVMREAAINSLVKLYEVKTKSSVKYYSTESDTPFTDVKTALPQYKTALLKAAEIGFLDGAAARPKDNLTMSEMLRMVNIIIQESGM